MEANQLNEGLVLKTRQVQIQFVIQELQYYSVNSLQDGDLWDRH